MHFRVSFTPLHLCTQRQADWAKKTIQILCPAFTKYLTCAAYLGPLPSLRGLSKSTSSSAHHPWLRTAISLAASHKDSPEPSGSSTPESKLDALIRARRLQKQKEQKDVAQQNSEKPGTWVFQRFSGHGRITISMRTMRQSAHPKNTLVLHVF